MLIDANILLFARSTTSPFHEVARAWLEAQLQGPTRVGLPWQSLVAFARIATNPRVYESPLSPDEAWGQVDDWLAVEQVWVPLPTQRHAHVLGGFVRRYQLRANLLSDAHLAALAIEHGIGVASADTDFARFEEVRWVNPLVVD